MRSKGNKKSKLMHYMLSPIRILKKATEFYVKSMEDCAAKVSYGGAVGCPAAQVITRLPKSFSVNSSRASDDDEELRKQLLRNVENKEVVFDSHRQQQEVIRQTTMGASGMGIRSCSVGLGKIGRIDEENPCFFEEDEANIVKAPLYPRSRSHAVKRNGVYR